MSDALDLLNRSERQSTWSFTLEDQEGSSLGDIVVDRDSPPTLSTDTSRPTKRTLQRVQLPPGVIHDVNVVRDRLRLRMLVDDGTVWDKGLYLFTASTHAALGAPLVVAHAGHVGTVDLVDQSLIVDQDTDRSYTARPGVVLTTFLGTVFAGLPITVNIVPSGQQVGPEAIVWPIGTNRLRLVNEVAAMLGYHELYFDDGGVGQLGPMPDPLTTDPQDVLNLTAIPRVYRPSFTFSDDMLDLPNRFVVVGSGASETPAVGRYNLPADVPHSAANRGFVVTHVETLQGVETNQQAAFVAIALSKQYRFAHETVDFATPPDARHDHYNTLEVEGVRYLEVAWSQTLREGAPMRHTARRTYTADVPT